MSKFLNPQNIESVNSIQCIREEASRPDYSNSRVFYFTQLKDDLADSSISEATWYTIMNRLTPILSSNDGFSETFTLLHYAAEILREEGINTIDNNDLFSIVDFYVDEVVAARRTFLSVLVHFDLSSLIEVFYKAGPEQYDNAERLILSSLIVLKCCPSSLMDASIQSIKRGLFILDQKKDYESLLALANYGIGVLKEPSETLKSCLINEKKAKKNLAKKESSHEISA